MRHSHKNMKFNSNMNQKDSLSASAIDTSIELTSDDLDTLVYMYQEEKLAMDVYDSFADQYDARIFDKISNSEQKHLDSIENILTQYDVNIDNLEILDEGEFLNEDLQSLYDTLIEQGSVSLEEALNVGIIIEETDIADLNEYLQEDVNPNIDMIYSNLENGSQNHLNAFTMVLDDGLFL